MADLATVYVDLTTGADLAMGPVGLVEDGGLQTAVILSLFTDRRAGDDDELPSGEADRRGWWGDLVPLIEGIEGYRLGSRLWLLSREKNIDSTLRRAEEYAQEALDWLLETGVAARIEIAADAPRRDLLRLTITIHRPGADVARWAFAWDAEALS